MGHVAARKSKQKGHGTARQIITKQMGHGAAWQIITQQMNHGAAWQNKPMVELGMANKNKWAMARHGKS